MKNPFLLAITVLFGVLLIGQASGQNEAVRSSEARIHKEVRHELIMLPRYTVFDNLAFEVNGSTVRLLGQVTQPVLKRDAETVVKSVEGVENVVNEIEVLPPSSADDRIRHAVFHAIYGDPVLAKYGWSAMPPIHIIVRSGHVTLEGVVDRQSDSDVANLRARGVPGTFSVQNNLRVMPQ